MAKNSFILAQGKKAEGTQLFVTDSDAPQLSGFSSKRQIVLWNVRSEGPHIVSVPNIIDENPSVCRDSYLDFVFQLSQVQLGNKTLAEHFELVCGYSGWDTSLIHEKNNAFKSASINDAVKLLAFQAWASKQSILSVDLDIGSAKLLAALKLMFADLDVPSSLSQKQRGPYFSTVKSALVACKHFFAAMIFVAYILMSRATFIFSSRRIVKTKPDGVMVFSYLTGLSCDEEIGSFKDYFWPKLNNTLAEIGMPSVWIYISETKIPLSQLAEAKTIVRQASKEGCSLHLLDEFIDISVITVSVIKFFRLVVRGLSAKRTVAKAAACIWPLLEDDYLQSTIGTPSLSAVLYHQNISKCMQKIGPSKKVFFLLENQPWERGLAWANNKFNANGHLYGVLHTILRFWDLRFFSSKHEQVLRIRSSKQPDFVIANGPHSRQLILESGFKEKNLLNGEALRYFHLLRSKPLENKADLLTGGRILLLGDYSVEKTARMVQCVNEALEELADLDLVVRVRFHPSSKIIESLGPILECPEETITGSLGWCNLVIGSSTTTATVDAYFEGLPLIIWENASEPSFNIFNTSHIVATCHSPSSMKFRIRQLMQVPHMKPAPPSELFHLDEELHYWKQILSTAS